MRCCRFKCRTSGLFIDEVGYIQQSRDEMEVLFTLLTDRYENGSVLLTSNLPFSKWSDIFKDPTTTAAAIDRLVHHSVIIELNLESYRLEESRKGKDPARQLPNPNKAQTDNKNTAKLTTKPLTQKAIHREK